MKVVTNTPDHVPQTTPGDPDRKFDYQGIPAGYYDTVLRNGHPIRRLWQISKFERVLDYLPSEGGSSILDIGCFAGTFLSLIDERRFAHQVGVDILPDQIAYARTHFGRPFRKFHHVESIVHLSNLQEKFECITLIEVIEHLTAQEISDLLAQVARLLRPGGKLVLTTPNYTSAWPLIELLLNRFNDLSYEEQHITKFTYFNMERRLAELYPRFGAEFSVDLKTTTHFITPFLAGISFDYARRLSRIIPHKKWRLPVGNLVLTVLTRRF
jgi:2-polyprenyl-3-methyl-5-hydroxy-6-metoxy-1,4-benzoquinol methylase